MPKPQMRKKEDYTEVVESEGSCGEEAEEQQDPTAAAATMSTDSKKTACNNSNKRARSEQAAPPASLSRQSLCRRVNAVVMGVIVPIGKRRKGLNRNRICLGGKRGEGEEDDGLPRSVSFVFTEHDALRRIVRRMLRECPKMCVEEDREDFLVALLKIMKQEEQGR